MSCLCSFHSVLVMRCGSCIHGGGTVRSGSPLHCCLTDVFWCISGRLKLFVDQPVEFPFLAGSTTNGDWASYIPSLLPMAFILEIPVCTNCAGLSSFPKRETAVCTAMEDRSFDSSVCCIAAGFSLATSSPVIITYEVIVHKHWFRSHPGLCRNTISALNP